MGNVSLDGTTGPEEATNLSVQPNAIHIENRNFVGGRTYDYVFLC